MYTLNFLDLEDLLKVGENLQKSEKYVLSDFRFLDTIYSGFIISFMKFCGFRKKLSDFKIHVLLVLLLLITFQYPDSLNSINRKISFLCKQLFD